MNSTFFDADLARIISYVTFDGHLSKNLSHFYLSSADWQALKDFEALVKNKFDLKSSYAKGTGFGTSFKCRFNSVRVSRLLFEAGAPKGDKMLCVFRVPRWIKENRAFSRAYLATAFQCEGWISKKSNAYSFSVGFKVFKSEELLDGGIAFVEDLKEMLRTFGVATSRTWLQPGNLRKDGKTTAALSFLIRTKSLPAFEREVDFGCDAVKNSLLRKVAETHSVAPLGYKNALWFNDFRFDAEKQPEKWRVEIPVQLNANLAKLLAYVMRYGNVIRNGKQFYVVSSSEKLLRDFAGVIEEEFGLRVPYATKTGARSYRCLVCSRAIVSWLLSQGLPFGKRALRSCGVPEWVKNNEAYYNAFSSV